MGFKGRIAIVGGGIGGLCTAIALQQAGIETVVFEGSSEIKSVGAGLGIGNNAIKALAKLDLDQQVIEAGRILEAMIIYDETGKQINKMDTKFISEQFGTDNVTIHRAALHGILLRNLKQETVLCGKKCVDFFQDENVVRLTFEDGSVATANYVIASDGIHSLFRKKLIPDSYPRYAGYTCWRGVADVDQIKRYQNAASETWGPNGRFGIVPLAGQKVYWFACVNAPYNDSETARLRKNEIFTLFKDYHAPIPELINLTKAEAILHNDIIDIVPIKQFAFGRILLIGDAAHATTPNMGQGAGQAIEDAIILASCISKFSSMEDAFKHFEKLRVKRTAKIIKMSRRIGEVAQSENRIFIKLRDYLLRRVSSKSQLKRLKFLYDNKLDS
ncbi:FAD-dependent monooxygenase [Ureibacillus aquaedulcis]|uniref:FAD-dependent monooxygenase n=1 Tax=Ureibacillus aquaedulcis TaxID=3058421 RepID=A0ABT8GNI1_9BACL|nr:FAD-dependent monooxygenase [Ureibacillus sp. BA0131]MDN4492977.1 FAD-dependent monooxygenase [Ureibacillus sp. BA0131]